jgi:hypothetical protein
MANKMTIQAIHVSVLRGSFIVDGTYDIILKKIPFF